MAEGRHSDIVHFLALNRKDFGVVDKGCHNVRCDLEGECMLM